MAPAQAPAIGAPAARLLTAGLFIVMAVAAIGTPADADLWGHLTFGRDIVSSGTMVQADGYSFTSDRPWINHEWLAEVTTYRAYQAAGAAGLIALKCAIIAAILGLVWGYLRRVGVPRGGRALLVALVFASTYWRTHSVRPQLFSVLLFAALLVILAETDAGKRRAVWLTPVLMALWVNFHGGWIVGIGVLGLWTAARLVDRRLSAGDKTGLAVVGVMSAAATLLNPYGIHLWSFLYETVGFNRADIEEWGSILSRPIALGVPWGVTLAAAAWAMWRSGWPRRLDSALIVGALAIASFRVSRLDAFLGLAVVILLAPLFAAAFAPSPPSSAPARLGPQFGLLTSIAIAVMIVPAAFVAAPLATCVTVGGAWPPEPEAARFISANHLKGRMLTWFDWGEYAIWHFGPDLQVSIDGRRETVYTNRTIDAHRRFYANDQSAQTYLKQLSPDYIWLPNRVPIASELTRAGWSAVFAGPVSSVLARTGAGPFQAVAPSPASLRCFPGQ